MNKPWEYLCALLGHTYPVWYRFKGGKGFLKENFHIPIFGRIIRRCCFTSIDRVNPRGAMKTINRRAALLR